MKCPNCGAEATARFCSNCGTEVLLTRSNNVNVVNNYYDSSVEQENLDDLYEEQGYRPYENTYVSSELPKKKTPTWLWVLGWIFIFPIPLTVLMLRRKAMKPAIKYGIIAATWVIYLLIAFSGSDSDDAKEVADSNVEISVDKQNDVSKNDLIIDEKEHVDANTLETAIAPVASASYDVETKDANTSAVDMNTAKALIEFTIAQYFTNYSVTAVDNGININVWQEGVALGAVMAASGDAQFKSDWKTMKDNVQYMAKSAYDSVKEITQDENIVITVNVVNDSNIENTLLSFVNGVCIYDCVQ